MTAKEIDDIVRIVIYNLKIQLDDFLLTYDDIKSVAYLGIHRAIETWDSKRGVTLKTYACRCAGNSVINYLNKRHGLAFGPQRHPLKKYRNPPFVRFEMGDVESRENVERKIDIEAMLNHDILRPQEKWVLRLWLQGMQWGELKKIRCGNTNAKNLGTYALRKLRNHYGGKNAVA